MEKKQAVALAQAASEFTPAEKYFVTLDEKVFTEAEKAVSNAMNISAGNPTVMEVLASELAKVEKPKKDKAAEGATGVELVKNTKAETIAKAQTQLDAMKAIAANKETALQAATPKNKSILTTNYNKAKANVDAAQVALDLASEMPEDAAPGAEA